VLRGVKVGKRCKLKRVIIDKWNNVPDGTMIGYDAEADRRRFAVSPTGIVVVDHGHKWD
jgi:glucose-1-phosphate adenylyltransferase